MARWKEKAAGPRTRRGKSENSASGEERRLRCILDAALVAFARQGFSRTPVAEVAAAAGVASGTVIYHFQTKENLLAVLAWECLHLLWRECSGRTGSAAPGPERLTAYVEAYFSFLRREPDRMLLLFKTEPMDIPVDSVAPGLDIRTLWQSLRALLVAIFQEIAQIQGREQDPVLPAGALLAHLSGAAWLHLFFSEDLEVLRVSALDLANRLGQGLDFSRPAVGGPKA